MILDDAFLLDPAAPTSSLTWSSGEKLNVAGSAAEINLASFLHRLQPRTSILEIGYN